MKKFAFFAPTNEMAKTANEIVREEERTDIEVRLVSTEQCVDAALELINQGTEIIIARGTQAEAIKRNSPIPVVEVVLTAQEMGLVIQQAKKDIGKTTPIIAVVGYRNMFCDMRHFNQLFDIDLREYYVHATEALYEGVCRAKEDGVDIVIGGEIVCRSARELGIRCIMQPHGDDSIRQAFRVASSVAYAAEQEKKTISELNTLLSFSFNGLIKVNKDGGIVALNSQVSELFGMPANKLVGIHIDKILPNLYNEYLQAEVLSHGKDIFTISRASRLVLAVSASPILVSTQIEGAIVSCHEVNRLTALEAEARKELQYKESPEGKYDQFFINDAVFMRMVRHYAKFNTHILISSTPGIPRLFPAKLLHRESFRNNNPFCYMNCGAYGKDQHMRILFGCDNSEGLLHRSSAGTLFIEHVELLDMQAQHRLYDTLVNRVFQNDAVDKIESGLCIVTGTAANLWAMVEDKLFVRDLYFLLTSLILSLPPLNADRWASVLIEQYGNRHFRYLNLSRSARTAIAEHPWNGIVELDTFCERLVITASQRMVDAAVVRRMLSQDLLLREYPERFTRDPETARITELLERFEGNRAMVADALGISKTTLWRRMKKLGLYDEATYGNPANRSEINNRDDE